MWTDIKVRRGDVLAAWAGIRPLVRNPNAKNTAALVRNHLIHVSTSGLLTVAGGKWTTYRKMAEEAVDEAVKVFGMSTSYAQIRSFRHHHVRSPETKVEMRYGGPTYHWLARLYSSLVYSSHSTLWYGDGSCAALDPQLWRSGVRRGRSGREHEPPLAAYGHTSLLSLSFY